MTIEKKKRGDSMSQWVLAVLFTVLLAVADYYGVIDLGSLLDDPEFATEWHEVYFTVPGDATRPPEAAIVRAINSARSRVWIASFDFDAEPIAAALEAAERRGVDARLVIDADNEGLPTIQALARRGLPVRTDTREALMHNKFIVLASARA